MKFNNKGFSIIELLVVISIFAVVGILSTAAVSLTLKSSRKSESLIKVRENVNYSLSVLERQIRNAQSIDCATSDSTKLSYVSSEGITSDFSCISTGTDNYIASSSSRLTSTDISITSCAFSCTQETVNNPPVIKVSISAEDAVTSGTSSAEKGSITTDIEIIARNY